MKIRDAGWLTTTLISCAAAALTGCTTPPGDDGREARSSTLQVLAAPPLVGRPTANSVTVRVQGGAEAAAVRLLPSGGKPREVHLEVGASHDFVLADLTPGTEYSYTLRARGDEHEDVLDGRFVTRRPPGESFRFAVFSDSHLPVLALEWLDPSDENDMAFLLDFIESRAEIGDVFHTAMSALRAERPDFVVCLGDMIYLPAYEHNPPFPSLVLAEAAYLDFRGHLGMATAEAAFFAVIGNWEGENGWHPAELRAHAQTARQRLLPNPTPETYPQGGGQLQDYYAWTWGDALLVTLNVMGYTTTVHNLDENDSGTPTSWTLGEEQWAWLEKTLASSSEPVKMIFMHHPVGGNGGDPVNSTYGRGGGRAARVGEQERLHELMIEHGVQVLFYGHDHVFTAMEVDGVHYVLPGSTGAPWKFTTEETGYEEYDPRSGFGMVEVGSEGIQIEFRDLEGEIFRVVDVDLQD